MGSGQAVAPQETLRCSSLGQYLMLLHRTTGKGSDWWCKSWNVGLIQCNHGPNEHGQKECSPPASLCSSSKDKFDTSVLISQVSSSHFRSCRSSGRQSTPQLFSEFFTRMPCACCAHLHFPSCWTPSAVRKIWSLKCEGVGGSLWEMQNTSTVYWLWGEGSASWNLAFCSDLWHLYWYKNTGITIGRSSDWTLFSECPRHKHWFRQSLTLYPS